MQVLNRSSRQPPVLPAISSTRLEEVVGIYPRIRELHWLNVCNGSMKFSYLPTQIMHVPNECSLAELSCLS